MSSYIYRHNQKQFSRFPRRDNSNSRRGINKSFDPRTVIGQAIKFTPVVYEISHSFSDFQLYGQLARNIADHRYDVPTPIQDQAIPEIMSGRDVVGIANTGTGKTAAFLIPLINDVVHNKNNRVLIIAPTRELAAQIEKELHSFSRGLNIYSALAIGGVSIRNQIKKLEKGPQFVIGTPGRLLDLESQRKIDFSRFGAVVLDEVDRMLDMGFIHSIDKIISKLPRDRQSLFFSATLDEKTKGVMAKFIHDPVLISVKTADASTNVHQDVIELKGRGKSEVLCSILAQEEVIKTLIFMRTKRGADSLHKSLTGNGFQTAVIHGNRSQSQRQKSLDLFRQGRVNILIATDVASRGIDIDDITHVINHDLPESYDDYIHRIGRTGRMNKQGIALTLVN